MKVSKLEKNIKKYAVLENDNFESLDLLPDEQIKHCIDACEDYYESGWVITNKGRVWSLTDKRWLIPWNDDGYWRVANEYVHRWVCYYFMSDEDKRILEMVEEHNTKCMESELWEVEVHHRETVEKMDYINMTDKERVLACMVVNHKGNLVYQIKKDHSDVHKLMNGKKTRGEEDDKEQFDVFTSVVRNGCPETYITYDEHGKKLVHMNLKLQGMTPEEDAEFAKRHNLPF